jgi:lipopolysaccharide assembly protein A
MRAVYWLVILVIAAVLSLFAASNRDLVSMGLWPLPFLVGLPLYLVVFAAVIIGFLTGVFAAWVAGSHRRRELKQCRKRSEALARELAATQSRLASQPLQVGATLPAVR